MSRKGSTGSSTRTANESVAVRMRKQRSKARSHARGRPPQRSGIQLTLRIRILELKDMNLNRLRSNLDSHESLHTIGVRQLPLPRLVTRAPLQMDGAQVPVARSRALNEAILKCLHRDDPLRHRYLRRRWQAS